MPAQNADFSLLLIRYCLNVTCPFGIYAAMLHIHSDLKRYLLNITQQVNSVEIMLNQCCQRYSIMFQCDVPTE